MFPPLSGPGIPAPLIGKDHGQLTGLSDDDHTGYSRLLGRPGGQTLNGGTATGENLTLRSTTHATQGDVDISGRLHLADSATQPPIGMTARAAPPAGAASVDDLYFDDGTNTASGAPGFRRCSSTGPDVWTDCPRTPIKIHCGGPYRFTEGIAPVEDVLGQAMINAAGWIDTLGNTNGTAYFCAVLTPTMAAAGQADVSLYDLGASPGPPGGPATLVVTLSQFVSGGPVYLEQSISVDPAGPGLSMISNTARLYEIRVTYAGGATPGDTIYVGKAWVELR
jgi:hypothetical protein